MLPYAGWTRSRGVVAIAGVAVVANSPRTLSIENIPKD
jgi:hypothetical protein